MKIIQSVYLFDDSYSGYQSESNFLLFLNLSLEYAKQYSTKPVELYGCNRVEKLLDKITDVKFININDRVTDIHKKLGLWMYPKVVACSLQKEPFIHIDNDFFLLEDPHTAFNKQFLFQSLEPTHIYYNYRAGFSYLNKVLEIDLSDTIPLNCGIMGFKDLEVVSRWCESIEYLLKSKTDYLYLMKTRGILLNHTLEQGLLGYYTNDVDLLVDLKGVFSNRTSFKFVHAWTDSKKNSKVIKKVSDRLRKINQDIFIKVKRNED